MNRRKPVDRVLRPVRRWLLKPDQCLNAVAKMRVGTWHPWVRVRAEKLAHGDRCFVSLPGGGCSIWIERGASSAEIAVASAYSNLWRATLPAWKARYRVLRAALGSVAESGAVPARDVERARLMLERAYEMVDLSRAA